MAYEQRVDAQRQLRGVLFPLLLGGKGINEELVVVIAFRIGLVDVYVRVEEADVAYRQLLLEDEGHPIHLGGEAAYREKVLSLLVVNGEAVYDNVGGEQPSHASQADTCADVVLQLGCQHDRHPLLHSG